jgi:hypothetical protein
VALGTGTAAIPGGYRRPDSGRGLVVGRGHAHEASEGTRQMALVGEARGQGNLGRRNTAREESSRLRDSKRNPISVWGQAILVCEGVRQVEPADPGHTRQLRQAHVLRIPSLEDIANPAQRPTIMRLWVWDRSLGTTTQEQPDCTGETRLALQRVHWLIHALVELPKRAVGSALVAVDYHEPSPAWARHFRRARPDVGGSSRG